MLKALTLLIGIGAIGYYTASEVAGWESTSVKDPVPSSSNTTYGYYGTRSSSSYFGSSGGWGK